MRIRLVALAILFALPLARSAHAQFTGGGSPGFGGLNVSTEANNASQGDTPGVRVSETFLLHTGLAVGAGMDSNVNYSGVDANEKSSAVTHVMPQLVLTNGGRGAMPDTLLQLVLNGDYRQYYTDAIGDDQKSAFGVGVGATLDIGTHYPWTLTLLDHYTRDVQPSYVPGILEFTRDVELAGARVKWRPGGGRLEEILTYTFLYDHFEEELLSQADSITNGIEFRSLFKFLPKTALFIAVSEAFVRYLNTTSGKIDSNPFHAVAGLSGLVTPKLTVHLQAGYGGGFYDTGPSPSTFVAGAEVGWLIGPFARAKLGYEHDFTNSLFGNYYDLDGVYANWNQQFGRYVLTGLSLRYEHRDYHCPPMQGTISCFQDMSNPAMPQDRIDNWVMLGLDAHYFPQPWFSAGFTYQLLANVTDFELPSMMGAGVPARFVKHQVLGVVSITY